MNKKSTIKIMLVDDHPVVLNGLKSLLKSIDNIDIVAEATTGKEALLIINDKMPDLVITDISMPEMTGIELTEIIKKKYPNIKVLILTVHKEREILESALFSGAEGCLQKDTTKQELLYAINKISDNGYYYCDSIMTIAGSLHYKSEHKTEVSVSFGKRELEIFELILMGHPNKEIAEKLSISYHTVHTHRRNIMKKTESRNLSGLYSFAKTNKLFPSLIGTN